MGPASYCLFDTVIGTCAIAWREPAGSSAQPPIVLFQLPEATSEQTESRIARNAGVGQPAIPPPPIAATIERLRRHLQGEVQDLRDIAVDLDAVSPFARQVYDVARQIPPGKTRTYGEIAKAMGQPSAAQEVGQALARNPVPLIVPCHRVLAADGKLGGFSAPGGLATKTKLLALEGAPVTPPLFS